MPPWLTTNRIVSKMRGQDITKRTDGRPTSVANSESRPLLHLRTFRSPPAAIATPQNHGLLHTRHRSRSGPPSSAPGAPSPVRRRVRCPLRPRCRSKHCRFRRSPRPPAPAPAATPSLSEAGGLGDPGEAGSSRIASEGVPNCGHTRRALATARRRRRRALCPCRRLAGDAPR